MKVSVTLFSLVLPLLARGTSIFRSNSQQLLTSDDDDLSVPGDNPLYYCSSDDKAILTIDHVDLSPNPPEAGKNLTIEAKGTLSEDIEDGAKVHLQVKYGLIRLINQEADLCKQVEHVNLECPLKHGTTNITKTVDIPKQIPPGKYTVTADVFTKDGDKITCLTASVNFEHHHS